MSIALVSMTQPLIEGVTTPEELIVYCARVSNPENQHNVQTSPKLLSYLIKHKHWSPFEMVDVTFEVVTNRAIAAQLLRHKSLSFQEHSMRYSSNVSISDIDLRMQAKTNRQSSEDSYDPILSSGKAASVVFAEHMEQSMKLYNEMIDANIAKESARFILPLASQSRLYAKGSLRSWIHYLSVRMHPNTQLEHRDIAVGVYEILKVHYPCVMAACVDENVFVELS